MKHQIVVLGAGYAGANAAARLAKRLHPADTEITLVNADPEFVERVRMHQLATGQDLEPRPLTDVFAGTGVQVRLARVTAVDVDRKTVDIVDADGPGEIAYDTLVYALGSAAADCGVPGVTEHAHDVAGKRSALRLRGRPAAHAAAARTACRRCRGRARRRREPRSRLRRCPVRRPACRRRARWNRPRRRCRRSCGRRQLR